MGPHPWYIQYIIWTNIHTNLSWRINHTHEVQTVLTWCQQWTEIIQVWKGYNHNKVLDIVKLNRTTQMLHTERMESQSVLCWDSRFTDSQWCHTVVNTNSFFCSANKVEKLGGKRCCWIALKEIYAGSMSVFPLCSGDLWAVLACRHHHLEKNKVWMFARAWSLNHKGNFTV